MSATARCCFRLETQFTAKAAPTAKARQNIELGTKVRFTVTDERDGPYAHSIAPYPWTREYVDRDVEDLLAERGLEISYETIRRWVLKFGCTFARNIRHRRPRTHELRVKRP